MYLTITFFFFFKIKYVEPEKFILAEHGAINSRLNVSCPHSFATCNGPQAPGLQMPILWMPQEGKLIVLGIRNVQSRVAVAVPCTPQKILPGRGARAVDGSQLRLCLVPAVGRSRVTPSCVSFQSNLWLTREDKRAGLCFNLK